VGQPRFLCFACSRNERARIGPRRSVGDRHKALSSSLYRLVEPRPKLCAVRRGRRRMPPPMREPAALSECQVQLTYMEVLDELDEPLGEHLKVR
jgi:hypothetical protein